MVITGSQTPLARLTRDKSRKLKNNKEETENNFNTTAAASVTTSITETPEVSRAAGHNIWLHISFHLAQFIQENKPLPFLREQTVNS